MENICHFNFLFIRYILNLDHGQKNFNFTELFKCIAIFKSPVIYKFNNLAIILNLTLIIIF